MNRAVSRNICARMTSYKLTTYHLMANQTINDLLWLADIHLMQGADMRHQHSFNTKTGQPGTNKAISRPGKNSEHKQKSNAQSHSELTHAVLFGGISGLILGTI